MAEQLGAWSAGLLNCPLNSSGWVYEIHKVTTVFFRFAFLVRLFFTAESGLVKAARSEPAGLP